MKLECGNCGAPLTIAAHETQATCAYCHHVTERPPRGPGPPVGAPWPSSASSSRIVLAMAVVGLAVGGAIVAFMVRPAAPRAAAPAAPAAPAAQADERMEAMTKEREERARARAAAEAARSAAAAQVERPDAAPAETAPAKPKPAKRPVYTGPVLSKADAEKALTPEILSCMRQAGTYYLITRLGNERQGSSVPPLHLTDTSVVDYVPTPGFARTPLGQCVARAGKAVRAPAYRGNYIYFGLHNDAVPDPLAGAPDELDRTKATQALSALDDQARDCATSHPAGSRPGEQTTVLVTFRGATGRVSRVSLLYVEPGSPYARCVASVYQQASTEKARRIETQVTYQLRP